ncbi:DciA family protein [Carnimonas nigrificans]|uniref:DciA family protein n=1 Tax=Carnimonas nigrificans TaxID=64323 RepID=UPI0004726739|nr:DciA family protein [Carnimonas nigrificans]
MSIKVKKRNAQPVSRLLANSSRSQVSRSELAPLLSKAQAIAKAQQQLEEHLPEELKGHVLVGGVTDGCLTILTDRAVWLTWLRFERARLLALLRYLPEMASVSSLSFKVRPLKPTHVAPQQRRYLSASAAEHIKECADYTDDPQLKAALARLAAHTTTDSDSSC